MIREIDIGHMSDSSKPHLIISLLGHPIVLWGETQLSISRRATRTLLYYLASQGKPVGRSTLTSMFWPEENEPKANANLRSLLGKLRNNLPDNTLLLTQDNTVTLDFSRTTVDQIKFETIYKELKNKPLYYPKDVPLPEPLKKIIYSALLCWSGKHFLEDTEIVSTPALDEWMYYTNLNLVMFRKRLSRRLTDHYLALGETDLALRGLIELTNDDQYNPELNYEILTLLLQNGRTNDAKARLSILKNHFEQVAGETLPEKILELEIRLNQQEIELVEAPTWPYNMGMNTALVGRLDELATLQQVYQKGEMAIIRGEGGSGKTRLVQEFYRRNHNNVRLLVLKCNSNVFPLQLDALIDTLNNQILDTEWLQLPNVWANILSVFVPKLGNIKPNINTPVQITIEKNQRLIFEALANLAEICAKDKKILLIVDDLQWADDAFLSAIQFLLSRNALKNKIILMMTYQPIEENRKISKFIKGMSKLHKLEILDLNPLTEEEVQLLADQIMPGTPPRELIHQLALATNGNPFFIIETIIALMDQQPEIFDLPVDKEYSLPESIVALNRMRLSRLSQQNHQFLKAVAVLGAVDIDLQLISFITGKKVEEVKEAIKELLRSGFLRLVKVDFPAQNRYAFTHEIIQKLILQDLSADELQDLHLKAARALEQSKSNSAGRVSAEIARHFEAGEAIEESIVYWLKTAEYYWHLYARQESQTIYDHINELLNEKAQFLSTGLIAEVYHQQDMFAFESADIHQLEILGKTCMSIGKSNSEPLLIGIGLHLLCDAAYHKGQNKDALDLIEKAIIYLQIVNIEKYLRDAYLRQGMLFTLLQQYTNAKQTYQRAFDLETEANNVEQLRSNFEAHFHLSMLLFRTGNPLPGLEEISTAYDRYQYILSPYNQIQANLAFSYIHSIMGIYPLALEKAQEGLEISRMLQNQSLTNFFLYIVSRNQIRLGYLDEAVLNINELISLSKQTSNQEMLMRGYGTLASVYAYLDDFDQALDILNMSLAKPSTSHIYYDNLCDKAYALSMLNRFEESENYLQNIIEFTQHTQIQGTLLRAQLVHAINLMQTGELSKSEQLLVSLQTQTINNGLFGILLNVNQALSQVYLINRQYEKMNQCVNEVLTWSQEHNFPWPQIKLPVLLMQNGLPMDRLNSGWLIQSKILLDSIEFNSQSTQIHKSFIKARSSWLQNQ